MKARTLFVLVVAGAVVGVASVGAWLFFKRPLEVWNWMNRRALVRAGLTQKSVATPVGAQAVFVGGSGPVLVLLHGAGDQAGTWAKVAPDLIREHTLIVPDLAGHGDSAPRSGPIEISAVLAGVEAVVDALAPRQRVVLVGNSLGAWAAMLFAHAHPDRVALAVCIDGGAIKGRNVHARVLPKTRAEARESVNQTRDPASAYVPNFVLDDIVRQAREGPLARLAATVSTMDAFVLDDAQLRELRVPVQLIWGASDRLVPLDYAEQMKAQLPQAGLFTIERCGHVPQVECPDALLAALRKALEADR
jgi:pimeloyl-ACP methyl ester carboxylesterase